MPLAQMFSSRKDKKNSHRKMFQTKKITVNFSLCSKVSVPRIDESTFGSELIPGITAFAVRGDDRDVSGKVTLPCFGSKLTGEDVTTRVMSGVSVHDITADATLNTIDYFDP